MADERARITAEMAETTFQRKVVSRWPGKEVQALAIAYFKERGYRSGPSSRPNQVFVMGGREGGIPRVNAEILIQDNVGKAHVTMVTISGFGSELRTHLEGFAAELRKKPDVTIPG